MSLNPDPDVVLILLKQFSAVYDKHHIGAFKLKNEMVGTKRWERWDRTRSTCTATRENKILGTGKILS